jgi:hypothetical protein
MGVLILLYNSQATLCKFRAGSMRLSKGMPQFISAFPLTWSVSLDVRQKNDVAGGFATSQQQLLRVRSPVEIEDLT